MLLFKNEKTCGNIINTHFRLQSSVCWMVFNTPVKINFKKKKYIIKENIIKDVNLKVKMKKKISEKTRKIYIWSISFLKRERKDGDGP